MNTTRTAAALLTLLVSATAAPAALADDVPPPVPPPPGAPPAEARSETVTQKGGPSGAMLWSGVLTLGLTYAAGAAVAGGSGRSADHDMFVPIAGPWMDLANRGGACGGSGQTSCSTETTYKVLIVADGIGQALGAFTIIDAFLNPETRTVSRTTTATADKPTVRFTPARMGSRGYGMLALGSF